MFWLVWKINEQTIIDFQRLEIYIYLYFTTYFSFAQKETTGVSKFLVFQPDEIFLKKFKFFFVKSQKNKTKTRQGDPHSTSKWR